MHVFIYYVVCIVFMYIFTYGNTYLYKYNIFMFSHNACINGCTVCIYIFMDVMFKCRYICMHACICMYNVYMLLQI